MPDSSIMLELCELLKISVNELLSGDIIEMKDYNEKMNENLIEMVKQKEEADKKLLKLEWLIGYISSISFLILIFIASFIEMQVWIRILLIAFGLLTFCIGIFNSLKIEQTAGYYECQKCHHKYVPKYSQVYFAMHSGTTRYMKCPKCNKKSWQRKTLSK